MKIITGIASTTHVDRHNERMSKNALDIMSKQIKENFIPLLVEHDWNQNIGVLLYAEVFQLEDGEHALGVVSGIFENKEEQNLFVIGKHNNVWKDYQGILSIKEMKNLNNIKSEKVNNTLIESENIANLLETHLDSTNILPDETVYKVKRYISSTGDLEIHLYPKDHVPKHFHVISKQRNINARFNIDSLKHINTKKGVIQPNDIKKIQNFFDMNPKILNKLKNEYQRMSG